MSSSSKSCDCELDRWCIRLVYPLLANAVGSCNQCVVVLCTVCLVQRRPGATQAWCNAGLVQRRPGATQAWCSAELLYQESWLTHRPNYKSSKLGKSPANAPPFPIYLPPKAGPALLMGYTYRERRRDHRGGVNPLFWRR